MKFDLILKINSSKINFDNVIKYLLSQNYSINESYDYMLRINNNKQDYKNIRLEINGINNIQNYCKNKNIDNFDNGYINFVEKNIIQQHLNHLIQ